jgi:hypothetical protein
MTHPAQRATFGRIVELVEQLRALEQPVDFYELQRQLFGLLYQVEERRGQCSRMIKRLQRGRGAPQDAPRPPSSGDLSDKASWELEAYVYERLARQLRTVGDGFAWRCFGYNRQVIQALSRNDSAGPIYGKIGLPYELGTIQHLWDEVGHFALHHDLTNCLRIADLTEFTGDGGALLREVKRTPHTEKAQLNRTEAAINALMHDGDLPGGRVLPASLSGHRSMINGNADWRRLAVQTMSTSEVAYVPTAVSACPGAPLTATGARHGT